MGVDRDESSDPGYEAYKKGVNAALNGPPSPVAEEIVARVKDGKNYNARAPLNAPHTALILTVCRRLEEEGIEYVLFTPGIRMGMIYKEFLPDVKTCPIKDHTRAISKGDGKVAVLSIPECMIQRDFIPVNNGRVCVGISVDRYFLNPPSMVYSNL